MDMPAPKATGVNTGNPFGINDLQGTPCAEISKQNNDLSASDARQVSSETSGAVIACAHEGQKQ
jgi:hypothetical protein